jgi:hypothetical protein
VTHYTVHDPQTHMKVSEHKTVQAAFRAAYRLLPLDGPGLYRPDGKYVAVQEWDDRTDPLRKWLISGRMP